MVEIGCAHGLFLHELWALGFDVTGVDSSPQAVRAARERFGHSVDIELAAPDHTPFDDHSFDYAVLASCLHTYVDPQAVVNEAARLARSGIIAIFPGRWAVSRLLSLFRPGPKQKRDRRHTQSLFRMFSILREACPDGQTFIRSAGFVPCDSGMLSRFYHLVIPFPLGEYTAIRIDFDRQAPFTGLPLLVNTSPLNPVPGASPLASREQVSGITHPCAERRD